MLASAGVSLLLIIGAASITFDYAENDGKSGLWRSIVYIMSGLDVDPPQTLVGQSAAGLVLISGIIFVSLLTGYVASVFSHLLLSSQSVPRKPKNRIFEEHGIIVGWGDKTRAILRELDADYRAQAAPADDFIIISEKPCLERGEERIYDHAWYYPGSPADSDVLIGADLTPSRGRGAKAAAILADPELPEEEADRRSLLALLAVEQLHPEVISLVEVKREEDVEHFYNAYADEVVVPSRYSRLLLARTSEFPGIAAYVEELLALAPPQAGRNGDKRMPISFYVRTAQALGVVGRTLHEAILGYFSEAAAIIVGTVTNGKLVIFPTATEEEQARLLEPADQLVVVARPDQV